MGALWVSISRPSIRKVGVSTALEWTLSGCEHCYAGELQRTVGVVHFFAGQRWRECGDQPHRPQNPRCTPGEVSQEVISPLVTSKFSGFAPTQVTKPAPIALWQDRQ